MININNGNLCQRLSSLNHLCSLWKNSFVENVRATTVQHKWMTDMSSIGIIGKGLSLVKAIITQKQEGRGEFQGGKNDKFNFQFQKPRGEFFGRIR